MNKHKLLIVGSFPKKNRKVYGGIARSCELIMASKAFNSYEIIGFDSSQKSNPPPHLIYRALSAFYRLIKFPIILFSKSPRSILIFCSDGYSAIEKGVMIVIAKIFRIPVLIYPRAGKLIEQSKTSNLFLILIRFLFNRADYFLCQGLEWKKYAQNKIYFDSNKIILVNNWTATSDLTKIGHSRIVNNNIKKLKFLFIGWIKEEKGIKELLNAFNNLIKKGNDIDITFVGDGKLMEYSESFALQNNLINNITFTGWVTSLELKKHLKNSDIFVLPSWEEGMPNSLIEALAAGLPSIVTSVGVIPNHLVDSQTALLIEPKSLKDLESSMERLIHDYILRKNLSKNGHLLAKNVFLVDKSLNKLSGIIDQTIN